MQNTNRIEKGIVAGWVVLVFIVILVAAALARFIVGDISAQEFVNEAFERSTDTSGINENPFTFSNSWIRATPPGAITAAAYLDISNTGDDDRLLAVSSDKARKVEIHVSSEQAGMMRMLQLESLPVPADTIIKLEPGAHHLMFIDISGAFVADESVIITLIFEKAGARDVRFTVKDVR